MNMCKYCRCLRLSLHFLIYLEWNFKWCKEWVSVIGCRQGVGIQQKWCVIKLCDFIKKFPLELCCLFPQFPLRLSVEGIVNSRILACVTIPGLPEHSKLEFPYWVTQHVAGSLWPGNICPVRSRGKFWHARWHCHTDRATAQNYMANLIHFCSSFRKWL